MPDTITSSSNENNTCAKFSGCAAAVLGVTGTVSATYYLCNTMSSGAAQLLVAMNGGLLSIVCFSVCCVAGYNGVNALTSVGLFSPRTSNSDQSNSDQSNSYQSNSYQSNSYQSNLENNNNARYYNI